MIWFTGDINYSDGYFDIGIGTGTKIKNGLDPFQNLNRKKEDIWVANFECVCSKLSSNKGIDAKVFRIEPESLVNLSHPAIYSVANNHVMQHGEEAYHDMLQNIKSFGSDYVGTDKKKSIIFTHSGKTISVSSFSLRPENFKFGTSYWYNPELKEIEQEFYQNVEKADFKIAYIHWGIEFMNYPYLDQRKLAHFLIDLGYDIIIGMHPHILQGYEVYNGKYIFYSIGNTVFNMAWYKTRYGALVNVNLSSGLPVVGYEYILIDSNHIPHIVPESEVPVDCRFDYLNTLLSHETENEKYFNQLAKYNNAYRKANHIKILKDLFRLNPKISFEIIKQYVNRRF